MGLLKALNLLSKNGKTKALAIKELRNEQASDTISLWAPAKSILEPSLCGPKAFPSRVLVLNQIMDSLRDPNLNRIGVYGIGGVGKTTLLQQVQRRALRDNFFQIVVMVSISHMPSLRRIQAEIADFIGLKLHPKDVSVRAAQMYERLKMAKVLIILDDLRKKVDLQDAGIPSWEESFGCKILLSSRKKNVLSCEMETQVDFSLNVLEQEEAWDLFQTTLPKVKDPKLKTLASGVAKKCAGLPLLVQIVAKVLQNEELNTWDDVVKQLSVSRSEDHIQERVHEVVMLIFENLPGEEKSLFLLCALFDQSSISVEHLLICCSGLDLLSGMNTIEEARNRLMTLINNLKESNPLKESPVDVYINMPGLVHDVAISAASKLQDAFIDAGEVRMMNWPGNNCTRISLPYCSNVQEIYAGAHCPMAESFLLSTESLSLEIPDLYFEGITGLKVVNITGMCFRSRLPSSIGLLTNLQSLCLNGCQIYDVAVTAELKQLQILSFANSNIVELPREMGGLTKLKLLNLTNCTHLKVIPVEVISKLYLLEELYMLNSFARWNERGNARLAELENLNQLSNLEIQIVDLKLIPRVFTFIDRLQYYKISIGDEWTWDGKYESSRILKIKLEVGIDFKGQIRRLLESAEVMYINTIMGIKGVIYEGLLGLKHLHIGYDYGIQHLLNSPAKTSGGYPILQSLHVYKNDRQEKIYQGEGEDATSFEEGEKGVLNLDGKGESFLWLKHIHIRNDSTIQKQNKLADEAFPPAFPVVESLYLTDFNFLELLYFWKLKTLTVVRCNKMKIVFTFASAICLPQLQELEVADCRNIEAIVGGDNRYSNNVNEFTQLSSLKLRILPYLKVFCRREEGTSRPKALFDEMVSFPNLRTLELKGCNSLDYIFATGSVKRLPKLEKIEINGCEFLDEIVLSKETEEIGERVSNEIVFPKLEYLSLCGLRNVRRFGSRYPIVFVSLTELSIDGCHAMDCFVSEFSASKRSDCLFNEMVTFSNLEIMSVRNVNTFKYLWDGLPAVDDSFFKLRSLSIEHCSKLLIVFPSTNIRRFQKLESLHLSSCDRVKAIIANTEDDNAIQVVKMPRGIEDEVLIEFPKLCTMKLKNLPYLTGICNRPEQGFRAQVCFPKLTSMELYKCNSLKYIFTTSTAECLMQLRELEIVDCKLLEEIIQSTEPGQIIHKIVFSKLDKLSLVELPKLKKFSYGHQLEFPSLKNLHISYCSMLKNFVPKYSRNQSAQCLFNEMVCFPKLEIMELTHLNDPKYICDERPEADESFSELKSLKIGYWLKLAVVFPPKVCRRFLRLETLNIHCCPRVKQIYQFEGTDSFKEFALRDLEIWNLPSVKHIWLNHPSGASCFKNLRSAEVRSCRDLKYVFPKSIACGLLELEHLKVGNSGVQVVIGKENNYDFETKGVQCFEFPRLSVVELEDLRQMSSLYGGTYTLKWPRLKRFDIHGCDEITTLGSEISTYHQGLLSCFDTFIHSLEELTLDDHGLQAILSAGFPSEFSKLKKVSIRYLKEESIFILLGFIRQHSVENLVVADSFLEEIFLLHDEKASSGELYDLRLKQLEVVCDDNAKHVLKDDSGVNTILENLESLSIEHCDCLVDIAPTVVSFRNLTTLNVSVCFKMQYLVTASTAMSMANLVDLRVSECIVMENIVAVVGNTVHQIFFKGLKYLELNDLPRLNCFCSGKDKFSFPVLERVKVNKCSQMRTFCRGPLSTPKITVVFRDEEKWVKDLNAAMAIDCK